MQIQKGYVKYKDRSDIICNYAVTDDGRQYYFLGANNERLANGNIIASKELIEAIDPMVQASNVGVIDENGNEVIPFENKTVKSVNNDILLIEKAQPIAQSVIDAIALKNDPLSAAKLVSTSATIKDKLNAKMGTEGRYIFNDQFSEATVCDINGNNLVNNECFSFIGMTSGKLYFSKNTPDSEITEYSILPPEVQSDITPTNDTNEININDVNVPENVFENALNSETVSTDEIAAVNDSVQTFVGDSTAPSDNNDSIVVESSIVPDDIQNSLAGSIIENNSLDDEKVTETTGFDIPVTIPTIDEDFPNDTNAESLDGFASENNNLDKLPAIPDALGEEVVEESTSEKEDTTSLDGETAPNGSDKENTSEEENAEVEEAVEESTSEGENAEVEEAVEEGTSEEENAEVEEAVEKSTLEVEDAEEAVEEGTSEEENAEVEEAVEKSTLEGENAEVEEAVEKSTLEVEDAEEAVEKSTLEVEDAEEAVEEETSEEENADVEEGTSEKEPTTIPNDQEKVETPREPIPNGPNTPDVSDIFDEETSAAEDVVEEKELELNEDLLNAKEEQEEISDKILENNNSDEEKEDIEDKSVIASVDLEDEAVTSALENNSNDTSLDEMISKYDNYDYEDKNEDGKLNFSLDDDNIDLGFDPDEELFKDSILKADKIINFDDYSDSFDSQDFKQTSVLPGKDTIMVDVAKSMTSLIDQNKEQKNKIIQYQNEIKKIQASRQNIADRASRQEQKIDLLTAKISNMEALLTKLESKNQVLESRVRDQESIIANQSHELEVIRPQLEGKEDLVKLLADAKVLLGQDTYGYGEDADNYYKRVA